MNVPLGAIQFDAETQPRVQMDMFVVSDYAEAMVGGAVFPPVTLFEEGGVYWIGDGFHRCQAARQAGLAEVDAEVQSGGKRAAILASCGANATHGLRRTNLDIQRAVTTLLKDPEWGKWSKREIARHCSVVPQTVVNWVERLSVQVGQIEAPLVRRGEQTYTMDTRAIGKAIGDGLTPDVLARAEQLELTRNQDSILRLQRLPADEQLAVLDRVAEGVKVGRAIQELRHEEAEEKVRAQRDQQPGTAIIYQADALEWLEDTEPTCDLLLTDPPYSTEFERDAFNAFVSGWVCQAVGAIKGTGRRSQTAAPPAYPAVASRTTTGVSPFAPPAKVA